MNGNASGLQLPTPFRFNTPEGKGKIDKAFPFLTVAGDTSIEIV